MTFQTFDGSLNSVGEVVRQRAWAKKLLNDRLKREDFFSEALFGEAAWDATLTLFSTEPFLSHCAESLASQLAVPLTTMARWIEVLENEGVIERRPAAFRPDKAALRLSSAGRSAVQDYLRATMGG